jgi:hypothetical protein
MLIDMADECGSSSDHCGHRRASLDASKDARLNRHLAVRRDFARQR